jgi:formylglycine-generating enzyme required for sulfatase activity
LADPIEVTNEKWNEVASWGRDNGYPNLQDAVANDVEPRTNITFWDALRWCNARSEKEGLTPAYYMDANEAINDTNQNGSYETGEYHDLDGNGQYSPGLTTVFRAGANIPDYGKYFFVGTPGDEHHVDMSPIKKDANGYRLPLGLIFTKLATGGNNQQNWPWGADKPPGLGAPEYADFAQHVRATAGGNNVSSPSPATARQPNGYGIKDVIGNVGEWAEDAWETTDHATQPPTLVLNVSVYGGSYLGLGQVNVPSTFSNPNSGQPGWSISKLWDLVLEGNPTTTSPAIGLRCVRYEP